MLEEVLNGYNVHTDADRTAMLRTMGLSSIEELFAQIPPAIRLQHPLRLPKPVSEWELQKKIRGLGEMIETTLTRLTFLGGGAYEHFIPAVVPAIASRGEYLTAYTPYQAEMSQGLLRMLHDFQIVMGRLLGLPAVNASVYDGATALAEGAWMCCSIKGLRRLAVSEGIWPEWRQVLETYMGGRSVHLDWVPLDPATGETSVRALQLLAAKEKHAGFLFQTPNRCGVIEPARLLIEQAHESDALVQASCNPVMLGCALSPGELGADIVSCEAQPLGLALNAGGPYLGAMATRSEFQKYLPGRIVGQCSDLKGEPALALFMEEREQHVSRHKATSHICSNQALLALRVLVYLSTLGEHGLRRAAELCARKAHYLSDRLCRFAGVRLAKSGRFFNEFLLEIPAKAKTFLARMETAGIFVGIDYSRMDATVRNQLLIAVTEVKSKEELDHMVEQFGITLRQLS
jgi:glycine dehydrogenase subunit 1